MIKIRGRIAVRTTGRAAEVRPHDPAKSNGKCQVAMEPGQPEGVVNVFTIEAAEVEAEALEVAEAEDPRVDGTVLLEVATWAEAGAEHHLPTTSTVIPLAATVEKNVGGPESQLLGTMLLLWIQDLDAAVA
jgi:hypothetical protein